MAVGVGRYARRRAFAERAALTGTVAPMGAGSVPGAVLGGLLVPYAPQALLELGLGIILNVSAWRIFRHTRPAGRP